MLTRICGDKSLDATQFLTRLVQSPTRFRTWAELAGWKATLAWAAIRTAAVLKFRLPTLALKFQPGHARHPVFARWGSSSDMDVYRQIFVSEEYACVRDALSSGFILDLGANVGYASAYFLSCFATATILAVEPDPANFELCRKNLAFYGDRVQVLLGAVWPRRSRLVLSRSTFGDGREWAAQVHESACAGDLSTVEGWDVPTLMRLAGVEYIDLLKIDIERSELQLFDSGSSFWLRRVRNICIELHGADCETVFLHALEGFDYDLGISGELTICRNLRYKASVA
jgi:FkbM family methyltransferase